MLPIENQTRWDDFLAAFSQGDHADPLAWVESLPQSTLTIWLRHAVLTGDSYPVVIPQTSALATHLSDLFRGGSPKLFNSLRNIIPRLLQEWGRDDTTKSLDDLLILAGSLRCAEAEPFIAQITTERLTGREESEEIALRQRCLSVLSGFGSSYRTEWIFKHYLGNIKYAALCYRALYRFSNSYAATEMPTMVKIHRQHGSLQKLSVVLRILFFNFLPYREHAEVIERAMMRIPTTDLQSLLSILKDAGITLIPYQENLQIYYHDASDTPADYHPISLKRLDDRKISIIHQFSSKLVFEDFGRSAVADVKTIYATSAVAA